MYTLDTNTIVYYLKGEKEAVEFLEKLFLTDSALYISAITEIELFGFSRLSQEEADCIDALIRTLMVIAVDSKVARIAGFVRREYGLKLADSAIAATAMLTSTSVVTRNVRDFRRIPKRSIMKI